MIPIISKLPAVGETIFTVMSSLAVKYQAINLGQGFPDFLMDEELINLVNKAMLDGHNQYVHMNGLPSFLESIAEKANNLYKTAINPDTEITVTPGATYGIYTALTAFLQPGDEVIYFEPAYDSYLPNISINGAIPVPIKLIHPHYSIDWDEVRKKITPRTRMIMVNTPHNPTGALMKKEDWENLYQLTNNTRILILSDEVYEHLIFDHKTHWSALHFPELQNRTIAVYSLGKVYHCTGWKLGYVIASSTLMKEFRKVHQFNAFTCNSPVQYAFASFLQQKEKYLQLGENIQILRDYFNEQMSLTPLKPLPSYGSYFQLYDYSGVSNMPESEYAKLLVEKAGVATIPVSAFYSDNTSNRVLRFCFAKKKETLKAAVDKLNKYFSEG